ncbi:MAG: ribose-5-phosphate isomerase RpiA [Planctomycetota bacterium]
MTDSKLAKRAAAHAAADLVQKGMKIGLGSGSTFLHVIERLAERMRTQQLEVSGVATSKATAEAAAAAGIPLLDLDSVDRLDLAIDGADEVDPQKNLIKGGGGAHVRERIVAAAAKEMVVIVDDSKLVDVLGKVFLLPVEVVQFGWKRTERLVTATGCKPVRRERDGAPFVTDNGNFILDCKFDGIEDPAWLAEHLNSLVGVVDHGLFVGMAGRVIVGNAQGKVRVIP